MQDQQRNLIDVKESQVRNLASSEKRSKELQVVEEQLHCVTQKLEVGPTSAKLIRFTDRLSVSCLISGVIQTIRPFICLS